MITLLEPHQLPRRRGAPIKLHLAHAKRLTHCGVKLGTVCDSVAHTTCAQCLRVYDVEMSNRQQITGETC